jgi:hypothetical protein
MRLLVFALLLLAGCCQSPIDSLSRLQVAGWGPHALLVYDPESDTLAWIDTETLRVVRRMERWNKGR